MIKRIKLENWKSHKNSEFLFRKGTNVLTGIIGAGKTSVIEAICYSLFGTYPSLNSKSVSLNEIIMNKPNQMEEARTEMEFEHKGKNYLVQRIVFLGKNSNQAKLFEEGQLIAGPKPNDVNERIQEIIEMNYDLFSRAVYSEQNQIDFFLKLSPMQRKKKFDEILELDKYEKARKTNVSVINKIKKLIEEKKEELKKNNEAIDENSLKELKGKKESKEKEVKELKAKKEEKTKKLEKGLKELEELQEKEKKFIELKEKTIKTESKISETENRFKEAEIELKEIDKKQEELNLEELKKEQKELEKVSKEISFIEAKIKAEKEKKDFLEKEIDKKKESFKGIDSQEKIEAALKEKENTIKEIEILTEKLTKELEEKEKHSIEAKEGILFNKKRVKEIDENVSKLSKHADCPLCSTELSDEKKLEIINSYDDEKKKLEIINKGLLGEGKKFEEEIQKIKEEKKEKEVQRRQKEEEKNKISLLKDKLKELNSLEKEARVSEEKIKESIELEKEKRKEFSEEKIKENQEKVKKIEYIIQCLKEFEKLSSWKKELEEIKNEKNLLDYKENSFGEKKEEIISVKSSVNSLEKELEINSELIESIKANIEKIEKEKNKIKEMQKIIEENEDTLTKLVLFNNALNSTQAELRKEMIDTINDAMDDVWNRIYPYGDFTSAKMIIEEGNYEIKVKEKNGKWTRVEGILSGGERSAAAICIRVAFSLVLSQNLSWLILDEPTHNLDRNSVSKLSLMMKEHLPNLVDQIFVITHDSEMEKAASGEYCEIERDKENEGTSIPKTNSIN